MIQSESNLSIQKLFIACHLDFRCRIILDIIDGFFGNVCQVLKSKLKEETERNEELVEEIGKLKKKMRDGKNEADDEFAAMKEVFSSWHPCSMPLSCENFPIKISLAKKPLYQDFFSNYFDMRNQ